MTTPQPDAPPPFGTDAWYEYLDQEHEPYPDDIVDVETPEAELEIHGADADLLGTDEPFRVVYRRYEFQLDTTGHPVREITGTITSSSGSETPLRLFLQPGWDPQNPADTAVYASRPLIGTARPDTDLVAMADGDRLDVRVSNQSAGVGRVIADATDLELTRTEHGLLLRGQFLANLVRSYRVLADATDDPNHQHNLEVLTQGLRMVQMAQDHLRDESISSRHALSRSRWWRNRIDGIANRTVVELLWADKQIHSGFDGDDRVVARLRPDGGLLPSYVMTEYTLQHSLETFVEDGDKYGRFQHNNRVGKATRTAAKDLLLTTYDHVVGKTVWAVGYPLADLLITGEGRDHMNRTLTAGDWARLGVTAGMGAVEKLAPAPTKGPPFVGGDELGTAIAEKSFEYLNANTSSAKDLAKDALLSTTTDAVAATADHAARSAGVNPTPKTDERGPATTGTVAGSTDGGFDMRRLAIPFGLFLSLLVTGLLFVLGGSDPADDAISDSPQPTSGGWTTAEWNELLGASPIDGLVFPDGATMDPPGGISWSRSGVDGLASVSVGIDETFALPVRFGAAYAETFSDQSSHPCGAVTDAYRVTCPLGAAKLGERDLVVVVVRHEGAVADGAGRFTYGLAFDDADDGDDYTAPPEFDQDFFDGTEAWYRLDVGKDGTRAMYADGFVDGVPSVPRASSAMVVERDAVLVWVVPVDELPVAPGDGLRYRVTAFFDDGPLGAVPDPATSGGDISGTDVGDPLIDVPAELTVLDDTTGLAPDVDGRPTRPDPPADPDAALTAALFAELQDRIDRAYAAGPESVIELVLPVLRQGPGAAACVAEADATIALATAIEVVDIPTEPTITGGIVTYSAVAGLVYETGTVAWGPLLTVGPGGRLFFVLPACL